MGKVTRFTGSKLLGAELRRLRGGRSLKQIAELTQRPPLSDAIASVAAPTLSQIENGISFPNLETLHSLSIVYRTPVQQLLDLVIAERLSEGQPLPASLEEAKPRFFQALTEGRAQEALRIASWAEAASPDIASSIPWRGNRALAMQALGLRDDAIRLLLDCISDPQAPQDRLYQFHQSVADVYTDAGYHPSAALHLEAAAVCAPADLPASKRARLTLSRAALAVSRARAGSRIDERDCRALVRDLDAAIEQLPEEAVAQRLLSSILRAATRALAGNRLLGAKELRELRGEAKAGGHDHAAMTAALELARLELDAGRRMTARKLLDEAAELALVGDHHVEAFEASFTLYEQLAEDEPATANRYLRRCDRIHPLIACRTPSMVRYERVVREAP